MHKGYVLIGEEFQRFAGEEVASYQQHCQQVTGGIRVPPVLYKGQVIEAGNIGERGIA